MITNKIYALAPMVSYSGEAYRILARKNGANLVFTEMVNSKIFVEQKKKIIINDKENLRIQICGNNLDYLKYTAKTLEPLSEGIDINFGCPQHIARKGYYGAYLQKDWNLTTDIIQAVDSVTDNMVSCKIRIFDDPYRTLEYAKMIERAGCKLLTVHGRTIEQKGQNTGMADLQQIRLIKETLNIPIIANGNICRHEDIQRVIDITGADGMMVAESHLYDPYIFNGEKGNVFDFLYEYIGLTRKIKTAWSEIKGHIFKKLYHVFQKYPDFREQLGNIHSVDNLLIFLKDLQKKLEKLEEDNFFIMQPRLRFPYVKI